MSKEVITVDGEDKVVRGDTARSYRGIIWALASIAIFIVIIAILFFGLFLKKATTGTSDSPINPANTENSTRR